MRLPRHCERLEGHIKCRQCEFGQKRCSFEDEAEEEGRDPKRRKVQEDISGKIHKKRSKVVVLVPTWGRYGFARKPPSAASLRREISVTEMELDSWINLSEGLEMLVSGIQMRLDKLEAELVKAEVAESKRRR